MGAQIGGNILLARRTFVQQRGGDALWERVLARLPEQDGKLLRRTMLVTSTYPLELNLRLDDAIAAVLNPGEPERAFVEMGRSSADVNLTGTQRAFLREGDPHYLLGFTDTIYAYYYAEGRRTYEKTGPASAVLTTWDAPAASPSDCLTVVGWHQRAIELSGGKNVQVVESMCRARGDRCCEYRCSWET
jgi:uncharacterized protein (TIGR02265 family)